MGRRSGWGLEGEFRLPAIVCQSVRENTAGVQVPQFEPAVADIVAVVVVAEME